MFQHTISTAAYQQSAKNPQCSLNVMTWHYTDIKLLKVQLKNTKLWLSVEEEVFTSLHQYTFCFFLPLKNCNIIIFDIKLTKQQVEWNRSCSFAQS